MSPLIILVESVNDDSNRIALEAYLGGVRIATSLYTGTR